MPLKSRPDWGHSRCFLSDPGRNCAPCRLRAKVGALSPEGHVFDYEDFEEIQGHQASPQCKGPRGIEGLKARRTTS